jgi:hypothetical protein
MQRFYEDGINRDGLLWVSDYRQQFLANWGPFGDAALARRSMILFAASHLPSGFSPACAAAAGAHQHTDAGHIAPEGISYIPNIPFTYGTHKMLLIHYSTDEPAAAGDGRARIVTPAGLDIFAPADLEIITQG